MTLGLILTVQLNNFIVLAYGMGSSVEKYLRQASITLRQKSASKISEGLYVNMYKRPKTFHY
jgi:hypothetical protein